MHIYIIISQVKEGKNLNATQAFFAFSLKSAYERKPAIIN